MQATRIGYGVLAGLAVALFASTVAGGPVRVIRPHGGSMQPTVRESDLVVVVSGSYATGDVVAYRSAALRAVVLHRIVSEEPDGYVTQGDANSWLDPDRPTDRDVVGRMLLRVPYGSEPAPYAGLACLVAAVAAARRAATRRAGHRTPADPATDPTATDPTATDPTATDPTATDLTATDPPPPGSPRRHRRRAAVRSRRRYATIAAVPIVVVATATAVTTAAPDRSAAAPAGAPAAAPTAHVGRFDYSAAVPRSAVYPDGRASAPAPLYLRLVEAADVTFHYELTGGDATTRGSVELTTTIGTASGWRRPVVPAVTRPVEGPAATARVTLPLRDVARLTREVERATGVDNGQYDLVVTATVQLAAGPAAGTSFTLDATLRLDDRQVTVADAAALSRRQPVGPARAGAPGRSRALPATGLALGLVVTGLAGTAALRGQRAARAARFPAATSARRTTS